MHPRKSIALGLFCAALAAFIIAVDIPYKAIIATALLLLVLVGWAITAVKQRPGKSR